MASVDMHDIDLKEFNEVLAACKGDVFMVTPEGDRLKPEKQAVPAHRLYQADRGRQHRGGEAGVLRPRGPAQAVPL